MRTSTKLTLTVAICWVTAIFFFFLARGFHSNLAMFLAFAVPAGLSLLFLWVDLKPLDEITDALTALPSGDFEHPKVPEDGGGDVRKLAIATNLLKIQLESASRRIGGLASGTVDAAKAEERVLKSRALSDADVVKNGERGLDASVIDVSNHMRRLAIQARLVARDELDDPMLDERVPGDLGEAFGLMVRNLRNLSSRANDLAEGKLESIPDAHGNLAEALNRIVERYQGVSDEVVQTAAHISASAEEILSVLREQEFAASHQASGVEETQRTMETLLSSAKRIAESAQTVFKSAERTQANNRTVAERISELKAHTERIGEILEVIKSIADRSDILALNASLEGMRAGEAGKGFALVAAEMRRLAENIKDSVGDIKELLSDIRESALSSVMATEEGTSLSERTTESALKITLITQQQQSGTEQVTTSMEELSSLINHGVSGMRQVTTAASELVAVAEDLRVMVEEFRHEPPSSVSGEFPTSRRRRRSSDNHPAASFPAPQPRETLVERPRKRTNGATAREAAEAAESRETMSMFSPVASGEDPPTVELTGLSEEEEREMLAEALRTRSRSYGGGEDEPTSAGEEASSVLEAASDDDEPGADAEE